MGTRRVPFSRVRLHRAGRLPRGAAAEVPPPEPGRGGAAALRLPHHLHRRGEGPAERRGRRGARPLRPGHARRRHARRAQGQGHHPLGVGGARGRGARCGSTTRSSPWRSRRTCPRARTSRAASTRLAGDAAGLQARAVAGRGGARARRCQFERLGYFCADPEDSRPGAPVFNRTVTLKDAWAKIERKQGRG